MKTRLIILISLLVVFLCSNKSADAQDHSVSVYYYPWYDITRHWKEGYLRAVLNSAQPPQIGEYSNRDNKVIAQHLEWSENFGIDNWICSWWGPGSWEDITIKNNILPSMDTSNVSYCLFYEAASLLNLQNGQIFFDDEKIATFRSHFNYIALNYFSDPDYYKIDGKPVVYIYLTRTFSGNYAQAIQLVRQDLLSMGYAIFLVGDEVYWGNPDVQRISTLDAITAYNMHGPSKYAGYPSQTNFITDVSAKYAQFRSAAENQGVHFIPNIMPGFNDRAVRLQADHYIIPNQFHPDSSYTSTFSNSADMAKLHIDSSLRAICITSFNEWHEDTQIEPTIVSDETATDQSATNDYTQGYFYKGYGTDFLKVVLNKFGPVYPVGVTEKNTINPIIYPNPANEILFINVSAHGPKLIEITSLNGQVMYSTIMDGSLHQIDLSKFLKGVYLISIKSKDFISTEKIIKL